MAGGRDNDKMKMVASFVTKDFKRKLENEAKRRGMTVSELIRETLKSEMGEKGDIGTQVE